MRLDVIDLDQVSATLPEIKNPKIFELKKFSRTGLFSTQIFGPLKSFHCSCSKQSYKGPRYGRKRCPTCGVDVISSDVRKKRFAKIELPFQVMNPLFFYLIAGNRSTIRKVITELLYYKAKYYFDSEGTLQRIPEGEEVSEDIPNVLMGLNGVLQYIDVILGTGTPATEGEDEITLRAELQYVKDHLDLLTLHNVLVIPPDFRPCGRGRTDNDFIADDINEKYSKILKISNELKNIPYVIQPTEDVYKTNFKYLQKLVFELYDYVLERMSKKTGLIRSNILGKRVDFSGRAVISPDPTLKLSECRLPYWMVLETLKPQLVTHLVNRRVCKRYNQAIKLIDESIQNNDTRFFDIVQDYCRDVVCVLNRQPTLHRLSVLAFKVKIHKGNTIQIHPMICNPFNADFDGDAMAVYFPITEKAKQDVIEHLGIWNNLVSPTDIESVPKPNQDIILGIYTATKEGSTFGKPVSMNGEEIPYGRYLFNMCLPEDYPMVNEEITKKKLFSIINDIAIKYTPAVVMNVLDRIKDLGFSLSTLQGYTMSLKDIYHPELVNFQDSLTGNVSKDMTMMKKDPKLQEILKSLPFSVFIESGARGSWDQARQMVLARGYVADANNNIRPDVIKSSLVKGLNTREFFNSCWGSRKGLLDTALSTGDTGYLTRQLIYSTATIELDETEAGEDCGTTDGLTIEIKNKEMVKALLGRYYIKENGQKKLIKTSDTGFLVGKTIKLRSPIYCTGKKICKTCYGNLHRILHSPQIGIVATQAVGERATQLVLRTFHISGAVQGVTAKTDQSAGSSNQDIISGMSIAKKLFHNPKDIINITSPVDLVNTVYKVFGQYGEIHIVHFEVIIASMMWAGDHPWRLIENRDAVNPEYISILQVPSRSSWLLGIAFSNLKQKLLSGLIGDEADEQSSITSLFRL